MGYAVVVSASAWRDLEMMPPRIVPAVVEFVFGDLRANPERVGKPLHRELSGPFSARRGPYRVLYRIEEEAGRVVVLKFAHRADAYRGGGS